MPKPAASSVQNGTNPQTDNANDNHVSDEGDSGGDQHHLHIHTNGRPERYQSSHAGRNDVDKDTDSSSNEDDDDDDDSDFDKDENSEDEEDGSEDNRSSRCVQRHMLSAHSHGDSARRGNILPLGNHLKRPASPGCGRRRTQNIPSTDAFSDSDEAASTTPDTKCETWPIWGFMKRERIGSKEFYTLDFSPDDLHRQIPSSVRSVKSRRTATKPTALRMATGPPCVARQARTPKSTPRPQKMKFKFTEEEDERLIDLKESRRLPWGEIEKFFPGRSAGSLQVHYCTKLRDRATVQKKPRRL
ncbi:hypothetical protein H2201_008653 [Coniosporium apollinis]|uniref:Myb-like domain-containing protein n=1 Tax=Coniosporium apollinis TaxID=61459 RepID=A0ABQ9NHL0_9PEZI|nr:hypothetical protein H2201_008653 [Coniosporium apollinis]